MMASICIIVIFSYICIQLWQLFVLKKYSDLNGKVPDLNRSNPPKVSIWVACRNEEKNIANCLHSLLKVDYPQNNIQILVGNDQSTDQTESIIKNIQTEFPGRIELINIIDKNDGLKAKARVMAQLDQHATGDYYLITDADVQVNPDWVWGMLNSLTPEIGVSSGTTMVKSSGIWGWLQEIDWTYFMGQLNIISFAGVPATAVGNNMIVKKDAYWQTGGYSAIKFSITEDYKLYSEICKKGWKWNNIMNPSTLAFSEKIEGFIPLLHQRKRWLSGGKELPWYWWILFAIFALYYFSIPVLLFYHWKIAIILLLFKMSLQWIQINWIYDLLNQSTPSLYKHAFYEFYVFLITISTAVFFLIPVKTNWKERKY